MNPRPKALAHSPLPWRDAEGSHGNYVSVLDAKERTVARIPWGGNDGGNAALIVQAVNSHADLLAACRGLLDMATDSRCHGPEIDAACAAIAKAGALDDGTCPACGSVILLGRMRHHRTWCK